MYIFFIKKKHVLKFPVSELDRNVETYAHHHGLHFQVKSSGANGVLTEGFVTAGAVLGWGFGVPMVCGGCLLMTS